MEQKFISNEKVKALTKKLIPDYEIFYPRRQEESWDWARMEADSEFTFEGHRTVLPLKYFFYSPQENLVEKKKDKPRIIFGARGCDTKGLSLLKKIYLEDPEDPHFRKDVLVFSADCTTHHPDCFCTVLGDQPWATENFDLNFSIVENGYLVSVGSDAGAKFLKDHGGFFESARSEQEKSMSSHRTSFEEELKKFNGNKVLDLKDLEGKIEKHSDVFKEYGKTCVSCSSCTNVCSSCFCFFLSEGDENKIRYMDSCQLKSYARVAGGANPREDLIERFKHRFTCKFVYRPQMQGFNGCTGCGRCTAGCQGKIDFQEVLIKVAEAK
ncbi:4Fe-4S dicluster domain-containing protein [Candidatus Calescamantes bacterium]|nr:4Fe-4S dicluster domain-containing protein [Candidatus Calescamantes bacterium]MCK5600038.1 4Fe-4S dicluster domain-containing protein [bacterium]